MWGGVCLVFVVDIVCFGFGFCCFFWWVEVVVGGFLFVFCCCCCCFYFRARPSGVLRAAYRMTEKTDTTLLPSVNVIA